MGIIIDLIHNNFCSINGSCTVSLEWLLFAWCEFLLWHDCFLWLLIWHVSRWWCKKPVKNSLIITMLAGFNLESIHLEQIKYNCRINGRRLYWIGLKSVVSLFIFIKSVRRHFRNCKTSHVHSSLKQWIQQVVEEKTGPSRLSKTTFDFLTVCWTFVLLSQKFLAAGALSRKD